MSAQPCGCDPEAHWFCRSYPSCAHGRSQTHIPEEVFAVTPSTTQWFGVTPQRGTGEPMSMTLQAFQSSIARTYKSGNPACYGLGIAGEAGEVADIVKKVLFHDEPINALPPQATLMLSPRRDDLRKELGDVLWYVAAVASDFGFSLDEIARANIDKLAERYPHGFVKGGGVRDTEARLVAGTEARTTVSATVYPETATHVAERLKPIRLPKATFRAIQREFQTQDRFIKEFAKYPGRPTMCVCATVFEEGDE